jgi:hypothetical protein
MTREEMLKKLGVTSVELHDFLSKYSSFVASLDVAQHTLISNSLPSMDQAMASFGPGVSADDLTRLFGGDAQHPPVFMGTIKHHLSK